MNARLNPVDSMAFSGLADFNESGPVYNSGLHQIIVCLLEVLNCFSFKLNTNKLAA